MPNAGGPPPGRALEVSDEAVKAAVDANLLTSVRLVREAVPYMRGRGWGRICMIVSAAVKQPIPTLALSNTARTGLWAWAKTAAADLFADGVTLNLACPGFHATDRTRELGARGDVRMGDAADFGNRLNRAQDVAGMRQRDEPGLRRDRLARLIRIEGTPAVRLEPRERDLAG